MLNDRRSDEQGVAMVAALAVLILGAFVVISIMVASRSGLDTARSSTDAAASEQLARDAGAMLANAYSTLASGEHDGFIPSVAVLNNHAAQIGGTVVANSSLPDGLGQVDQRVPSSGQYAVQQPLGDGRTGGWQLYSVKLPDWGTTPGGRVVTYVRTWTTSGEKTTRPMLYRLEFRPTWFADYQMLFDGPQIVGNGAQITGRVHSNGYGTSYYGQYESQAEQIRFEGGATCTSTARITTAAGSISAPGSCNTRADTGLRYNFLRARNVAARLRELCRGPAALRPTISMACPETREPVSVQLAGTSVIVNGTSISASVPPGGQPGSNQGAVVITEGDVELSGTLGDNARALLVAATTSGSARYGAGGAPTAWIRSNGNVGASGSTTSSFGIVAEGDVVFDEHSMTSATARGAFLTLSGMVSSHPTWRTPVVVAGGIKSAGVLRIEGSITGHYPPLLYNAFDGGFQTREFAWNDALYDNPPPMFPTAADWEITRMEPANLDCFAREAGGKLNIDRGDCA